VPGLGTGVLVSGAGAVFEDGTGVTACGGAAGGGTLGFITRNITNGTASKKISPQMASE
jgi:hypothetical protein